MMDYNIININDYNDLFRNPEFYISELNIPFKMNGYGGIRLNYNLFLKTNITKKIVGIKSDDNTIYNSLWEYRGCDEYVNFKDYYIFQGVINESKEQNKFENHLVAIEKEQLKKLLINCLTKNPNSFSREKLKTILGFKFFDLIIDESHKIIGEKIKNIYHLKSYPLDRNLAVILEIENGMHFFMIASYINAWHGTKSEDSILKSIVFENNDLARTIYKGVKIYEIFEDDGNKYLRLENGYEIGITNEFLGSILHLGNHSWIHKHDYLL